MNFTLVCTASDAEVAEGSLFRLFDSVQANVRGGHHAVDIVLVLRHEVAAVTPEPLDWPRWAELRLHVVHSGPLGISAARNLGLAVARANEVLGPERIVGFPDDDCRYEPGLLDAVAREFARDETRAIVCVPFGPTPESVDRQRFPSSARTLRPLDVLTLVASAGLFISAALLEADEPFNETLGVGAEAASGEEIDLVLRLLARRQVAVYVPQPVVLHPYANEARPERVAGRYAVTWGHAIAGALPRRLAIRVVVGAIRPTGPVIYRLRSLALGLALARRSIIPRLQSDEEGLTRTRQVLVGGRLALSDISQEELVRRLADAISGRPAMPTLCLAAHVSALNAADDQAFLAAYNAADLSYADGYSVQVLARLSGARHSRRLATTDLWPRLLNEVARREAGPLKVAIIGGAPGVAEAAAANADFFPPTLVQIVACFDGYQSDYHDPLQVLQRLKADVLLLGLGMPLEALWLAKHADEIGVSVAITCGGMLRLVAGQESRAPGAMQNLRCEWAWRLLTDGRRTRSRYLVGLLSVSRLIGPSLRARRR
jgi:N-acetylglucosaminyldiphosphoundecaprenol N-acetyl-beta-D-mannosaminyltransferase